MGFDFHAERSQRVVGNVVMLPQKGSTSGGSRRLLNLCAILFDTPYSWTLDGIGRLADEVAEERFATLLAEVSSGPTVDPGRP